RRRNVFRLSPESLPDFFRDRIETFRPADALRRVRKKITRTLPGRVELRDRLIKIHAYSAYQPRCAVQLPERFTQRRVLGCGPAPGPYICRVYAYLASSRPVPGLSATLERRLATFLFAAAKYTNIDSDIPRQAPPAITGNKMAPHGMHENTLPATWDPGRAGT